MKKKIKKLTPNLKIIISLIVIFSMMMFVFFVTLGINSKKISVTAFSYINREESYFGEMNLYGGGINGYYYKNREKAIKKLKKSDAFKYEIDDNNLLLFDNGTLYIANFDKKIEKFTIKALEMESYYLSLPFVFYPGEGEVISRLYNDFEYEFDLRSAVALKDKTFEGLANFYKSIEKDLKFKTLKSIEFLPDKIVFNAHSGYLEMRKLPDNKIIIFNTAYIQET